MKLIQIASIIAYCSVSAASFDINKATADMDFFKDNTPRAGKPTLADMLGLNKQCTIINDYAMGLGDVMARLLDEEQRTLILAPINSAIVALPRKPWQGDAPDAEAIKSKDQKEGKVKTQSQADDNIARFVKRHVIPQFPISQQDKVKTLAYGLFWYKVDPTDKTKCVYPGGHKVLSEREAANGAIWTIDGVMTHTSADALDGPEHKHAL